MRPPETAVAVPATTAVRAIVPSSPGPRLTIIWSSLVPVPQVLCGQSAGPCRGVRDRVDDLARNALVEHQLPAAALDGHAQIAQPQVLEEHYENGRSGWHLVGDLDDI